MVFQYLHKNHLVSGIYGRLTVYSETVFEEVKGWSLSFTIFGGNISKLYYKWIFVFRLIQ